MGRDKAVLRIGEETLVERAVRRLAGLVPEVLVADRGRGESPAGSCSISDGPGAGPAAGILGAMCARPRAALLVLGCDLPAVPAELLGRLLQLPGDWVVPVWEGRVEPLAAFYRGPALRVLARRVAAGRLDLRGLREEPELSLTELRDAPLSAFGAPRQNFVNLNRPADLEAYLRHGERLP